MIGKLEHFIIALGCQALLGLLFGLWFLGGLLPVAFFAGREHAQAEYRWIAKWGDGRRENMPWWGGFDPRIWDVHSLWWNLSFPTLGVFLWWLLWHLN